MILTDQDAKTLENNAKFKSVELNENFMNVDQNEGNLSETQNEDDRPASPEELQISLFEAKKLNDQHVKSMRDQRSLIKHKEAQQFRQENIALNEASI